jgi:hypothetical protein
MCNTVVMLLLFKGIQYTFCNINFRCDSSVIGRVHILDYGYFTCGMAGDSVIGENVMCGRAVAEADVH